MNKPTWTKEQKEYLDQMEERIVSKIDEKIDIKIDRLEKKFDERFDKLFKLFENHIKQDHK